MGHIFVTAQENLQESKGLFSSAIVYYAGKVVLGDRDPFLSPNNTCSVKLKRSNRFTSHVAGLTTLNTCPK